MTKMTEDMKNEGNEKGCQTKMIKEKDSIMEKRQGKGESF